MEGNKNDPEGQVRKSRGFTGPCAGGPKEVRELLLPKMAGFITLGGDMEDFLYEGFKDSFTRSLQGRLKKVLPEHLYQRLADEMCQASDHAFASENDVRRMEIEEKQLTFDLRYRKARASDTSEEIDSVDPGEVLDEFTSGLVSETTQRADEFADFIQFWAQLQQNLSPELFDELTQFTQKLRKHIQQLDLLLLYKRRRAEQLKASIKELEKRSQ